jgi:hypothetical protein
LAGGLVLELYPCADGMTDNTRIGLYVSVLDVVTDRLHKQGIAVSNRQNFGDADFVVVQDPDGRKVELVQKISQLQLAA